MSTQEQTDFKLALKLQQQEMESRSAFEISPCSETITTTRVNNELDLNVNPDASVSSECSTERGTVSTLKTFDGTKTSLGFLVLNT